MPLDNFGVQRKNKNKMQMRDRRVIQRRNIGSGQHEIAQRRNVESDQHEIAQRRNVQRGQHEIAGQSLQKEATVNLLKMKRAPNIHDLTEFERDPDAALLSLAANSGLSRFSHSRALFGKGNSIDENDPQIKEILKILGCTIDADFKISDYGRIVDEFQKSVNLDADLISCACCGVRSFQKGTARYIKVDLVKLKVLKLNKSQEDKLLNIPLKYRRAISYFQSKIGKCYYHLHPELVTIEKGEKGDTIREVALLCATCEHKAGAKKNPKIPPFSIASGIDYGVPARIDLPSLTLVEQYVLARVRLYGSIVKLPGWSTSVRHSARKGHVISFPQPESPELCAEKSRLKDGPAPQIYPRSEGLSQLVSVVFIGAKTEFAALEPSHFRSITDLQVRFEVVIEWLRALKALNPFYHNIIIDESSSSQEKLNEAIRECVEKPRVISNELELAMEEIAAEERAATSELICESPVGETSVQDQLPMSFLTKSSHTNTRNAESSIFTSLDAALRAGSTAETTDLPVDSIPTATETCRPIEIKTGSRPVNEFAENDRLLYCAFPFLFLLGRGLQQKGQVNKRQCRHLLMQFTCNFSTCHRFIFCLFDQLQRHSAVQTIAAKFKNNPESLKKLQEWVSDPQFLKKLKQAAMNPNTSSSKALLAKITPHISTFGSKVPFSPAQRKGAMKNLIAMTQHFGMPGVFLTYAPDFTNGVLGLRLSVPSTDNASFPASDGGFLDAIRNSRSVFENIKLTPDSLIGRMVSNPVAMAEFFRILTEAVFTILIGSPPEELTKQTLPLCDRMPGLFGPPVASFGVVEEQARGTPHCHALVWGGLSPSLIQNVATVTSLMKKIAAIVDQMVSGELQPRTLANCLLNQFNESLPISPALKKIHNPVTHPSEFENDVQCAAQVTNLHSHTFTCHKGKQGKVSCRLSRPAPVSPNTHCVQILPSRDKTTGKVDYSVLDNPSPPHIDSLPGRNLSRLPVARRDCNLHYLELKRPKVEIRDDAGNFDDQLLIEVIGDELFQRYSQLSEDEKKRFSLGLEKRNGMVVEFNPVISSLLGCNTNVSVLGSDAQAKATLCYLLKYITKPPSEISHAIAIIHNARQTIQNYPSQADDTGSERRTAMHFLARVVNQFYGTVEVSAPVAALALLGMPAEISSHGFHLVFVNAAVAYALRTQSRQETDADFDDLPSRKSTRLKRSTVSETYYSDHDDCDLQELVEEECTGPFLPDEAGASTEPNEDDDRNISATVYGVGNERKAVMQHVHYAFRGHRLSHYSLYEYAALISIVPKSKSSENLTGGEYSSREDSEDEENIRTRPGRIDNGSFNFHPEHPLFASHYQRLRSKTKVPVLIKSPPKCPPPKPQTLTDEWRKAAREFSRYVLVLFKPWDEEEGTSTGPLTWNALCKFMDQLEFGEDRLGPTILETARRRWIENTGQGLRISTEEKIANQMYRNRAATKWGQEDHSGDMVVRFERPEQEEQPIDPALGECAQKVIDELRAAAASDDPGSAAIIQQMRYIKDTEDALRQSTSFSDSQQSGCPSRYNSASTVLHGRSVLDPTPKDIYEKLLPNFRQENNDDEDSVILTGPSNPFQSDSTSQLVDCYEGLNFEQSKVMKLCLEYFQQKKRNLEGNMSTPKPFHLLVHGGPGTGKSFLVKRIIQAAGNQNLRVISMAFTGIAAGLIPGGDTCHHTLSINCGLSTSCYPPTLRPEKVTELRRLLAPDTLAMVIIDEISFIGPEMLAIVQRRLNEIIQNDDPNSKFGGLAVVLMGDFYQLPPVAQESLFTSAIELFARPDTKAGKKFTKSETWDDGTRLFAGFRKIELRQQVRAAQDPVHTALMDQMRFPRPGQPRVPPNLNTRYKTLSARDVENDDSWGFAPVIVTTNNERANINAYQSARWAKVHQIPRITWRYEITGSLSTAPPSVKEHLYETVPQLTGYFIYGAPGYLSTNINPGRRLSNGTKIVYEAIKLDERENIDDVFRALNTTPPGKDVRLNYPPLYIIASVPDADPTNFTGCTMANGRVVVPIPRKRNQESLPIKGFPKSRRLQFKAHGCELRFAFTVHKVQGHTCKKIILQLNKRPFIPKITFCSLLVALSRVSRSEDIRLMPLHPGGSDFSYLSKLEPPKELTEWMSFFVEDDSGSGAFWDTEKARAYYSNKRTTGRKRSEQGTGKQGSRPVKKMRPTEDTLSNEELILHEIASCSTQELPTVNVNQQVQQKSNKTNKRDFSDPIPTRKSTRIRKPVAKNNGTK